MTALLAAWIALTVSAGHAAPKKSDALPPEAQAMLKRLPGETLTVGLVVSAAMRSSDDFRAVRASAAAVPAAELQAEGVFDPVLSLNAQKEHDERETTSPFSSESSEGTGGGLSLSKYFGTGTTAELKLGISSYAYTLPAGTFGPTPAEFEGHQAQAGVTLKQNLWKDAFGSAARAGLEAGRKTTVASQAELESNIEQWSLALMGQYYQAWLFQEQVRAARTSLERRERLLSITRIRTQRGTSERPDLLQVESARTGSAQSLASARQALDEMWRELVTSLKFPDEWLTIDPMRVPIQLDNPLPEALAACGKREALNPPPSSSAYARTAFARAEAARASERSARSRALPTLQLQGSYEATGIDSAESGAALSEAAGFDRPRWALGAVFSIPIGSSAEEAEVRRAGAQLEAAEAQASSAAASLRVGWLNVCNDLHRLRDALEDARAVNERQAERARLEEERYRIGRSQLLQVIQAGDDATGAEVSLRQAEVQARLGSWAVARLDSRLQAYLKDLVEHPIQLKD
ncbi:MAG: TolC family protein [Bdellovibrionales bacterium]|nr:TolC family protein [Bdellovibrionales bacterium]